MCACAKLGNNKFKSCKRKSRSIAGFPLTAGGADAGKIRRLRPDQKLRLRIMTVFSDSSTNAK
jgi:hypothetical protein